MYKNKIIKTTVFLIFTIVIMSVFISATSAAVYEPTTKYDSGTKIIKVNNEKFKITWETEQVVARDKKHIYINYKSLKNKKKKGYLDIDLEKTSKKKMAISQYSSSMVLNSDKTIKTKTNTNNYYLKKIRPKIFKLAKNSILNKATLKFNKVTYVNRTVTDSATNETVIKTYKINWKVYYYAKTSSIEILKRYTELNKSNKNIPDIIFNNVDVRIDKFAKNKLKITNSPHRFVICGSNIYYKYVKTKLSPKQYYLMVYKNNFGMDLT